LRRLDRHGDRRGGIDDRELEALLAQHLEIGREAGDGGLGEGGEIVRAFVPPIGQRALRIDIDQHDRTSPGALRLDRQMPGERGLARAALLRCNCQNPQSSYPRLECGAGDPPNGRISPQQTHHLTRTKAWGP